MELDDLLIEDVREALVTAKEIYKTIRSTNPRTHRREYLHIIQSTNFAGVAIYTKGKLANEHGDDICYLLISSKRVV